MRVVSLAPALTESVVVLGGFDELVGVSVYCRDYAPGKPVVGSYISVSWRLLERVRPDIVLLQDFVQRSLYVELRRRGYRAFILPLPSSLYGVADNVAAVGALIGRRAEGLEYARRFVDEVLGLERSRPRSLRRVYAEYVWPDFSTRMSPGGASFADHALRLAGVLNIYSDRPSAFVEPRVEEVVEADPWALVISAEKLMRLTLEKYLEKTPWARRLRAVKEGRIVLLSGGRGWDLAHPGPSIIETVRNLRGSIASLL